MSALLTLGIENGERKLEGKHQFKVFPLGANKSRHLSGEEIDVKPKHNIRKYSEIPNLI
jgi:hypothetical protein